ncbi:MAG TPA: methyltransferase domain-containing protein [Phycisphaerae bacterium]|nr:methyltransferase domain-containing protein [Phycisphaerae bacterium]HRW54740.1 methyltransferase domain-containing protein [Phycisphaerae bacterium]
MSTTQSQMDVEQAVRQRYSDGAREAEPGLCCPSSTYNKKYLAAIPAEVIEKDYGCGDPTAWAEPGMTVLDLGSGAGKACYIISQRVGPDGRVIGIDMNDDMLDLARKHQKTVADNVGWANVSFRKAKIQDLRLDLDKTGAWLQRHPIKSPEDLSKFEAFCADLSASEPVVPDNSVDLIVSNCVLNLVRPEDKAQLFREMFRVLRKGGRAVISDVVCDEDVPEHMTRDENLWSGCLSGAYREDLFLRAFEDAGFHGVEVLKYDHNAWQTVEGIEFRSMTVRAFKGKQGPCFEHRQAVMYKGPFSSVMDDDNHRYPRGVRIAVCKKTFDLLQTGPYAEQFVFIEPREAIDEAIAQPFDCRRTAIRSARETKGAAYDATIESSGDCCGPEGCC